MKRMEKETKTKQDLPKPQGWDKTDRNFQRTDNEEDVKGELGIRGSGSNADKKKSAKKDDKPNSPEQQ
jgi:hypothetical protein